MILKEFRKLTAIILMAILVLVQGFGPALAIAQEASSSSELIPQETAEPTPAPTLTESSQAETTSPSPEASPSPEVSASPTPSDQPEVSNSNSSPIGQPNAPPVSSSPSPTITPLENVPQGHLSVAVEHASRQAVKLNLSQQGQTSASLTTDKADYSPTDIVYVSGSGFVPDTEYTLIITSNDPPEIYLESKITADSSGNFVYTYQLDGNYRPNYKVEVKDQSGTVVASTTFTDSVTVTAATGGSSISGDKAANATNPVWTTLTNIVIAEPSNSKGDFAAGTSVTLILTTPTNWSFNSSVGSVGFTANKNITSASISVGTNTATITYTVSGTNGQDTMTISGLQVRANNGSILPSSGNILSSGTGSISGITNGTTNFGSLSQVVGTASKLGFNQQPTNAVVGSAITPAVTVQIQDQFGNLTSSTANVSMAIGTNPSSGTLSGGSATAAVTGTATFSNLSIDKVGTGYTLTASGTVTSATSNTFNITQKTVTASVTSNNKTYDGTNTATISNCSLTGVLAADSGNVTCSASSATFADKNIGNGKTVTATGITLGGSAAANYQLSSTMATTTANISVLTITVTAATNSKTYDGTTSASAIPIVTSGALQGSDTSNFTETYNDENVGTGKTLTPTGSVNDGNSGNNYTVTFVNNMTGVIAQKAITVTADAKTKTYGDVDPTLTYQITSGVLQGTDAITGSLSRNSGENAGTYTINQNTLTAGSNYNLTYVSANLTITKATPSINWSNPADITYGTALSGTQLNATSAIPGTFVYTPASGTIPNAGNAQTLSVTLTPTDITNYNSTSSIVSINVLKTDQIITFNTLSDKTYGDADFSISATASSGLAVSLSSQTTGVCTVSGSTVHIVSVGTCTIHASQAGDSNYNSAPSVDRSFAVSKKALTVSALGVNRVYNGTTTATVTLSDDRVSGDILTLGYTNASFADQNVGSAKTVSISGITVTGTDSGKYTFNTIAGTTGDITTAVLTYTANSASRSYGSSNPVFSGTVSGFVGGENQAGATIGTLTFTTSATTNSNVGSYAINGSGLTANNGNYSFVQAAGNATALTITKATPTVTVNPVTTIYDGNPHGTTGTVSNGLGDATISYSGTGNTTYGPSNIAPVNAGNYIATGTFLGNSNYNQAQGTASIRIDNKVSVNSASPQVVITDLGVDSTIDIPASVANATLDLSALSTTSGGITTAKLNNSITINSTTSAGNIQIIIPAGTKISSSSSSWNGIINAPQVFSNSSVSIPSESGVSGTSVVGVLEVGLGDSALTFDKAVRIVLTGKATKSVGFVSGSTFTEIKTPCAADDQATGNALSPSADCKIDVGSDLVIWTKHFSKFVSYDRLYSSASSTSTNACNDNQPGGTPSFISAVAGTNTVTLTWKEAPDPVSYYLITYGTTTGAQTYGNPNVGGKGTTSYTVGGLSGGQTYYFRIRAGNGCMPGSYSGEISAFPGGGAVSGPAAGFTPGVLGVKTQAGNAEVGQEEQGEVKAVATESSQPSQVSQTPQPQSRGGSSFNIKTVLIIVVVLALGFGVFKLIM